MAEKCTSDYKINVKIDLASKELWCHDKSTRMLRVTLFSGLTRQ